MYESVYYGITDFDSVINYIAEKLDFFCTLVAEVYEDCIYWDSEHGENSSVLRTSLTSVSDENLEIRITYFLYDIGKMINELNALKEAF